MFDPIIYITVRDRLQDLKELVGWLERAGHQRIVLLDNASTWPPLVEYLKASPHDVRWLRTNGGSRTLWEHAMVPDEWFVVTDPDILPTEDCPLDLIAHLHRLLDENLNFEKAGVGLYLEDVPADLSSLEWERKLMSGCPEFPEVEPGVHIAPVDTTLALYRAGTPFMYEAIRTGRPYLARHMSWYREGNPTDEDRYYLEHAIAGPLGSSWAQRVHRCD